MAKRNVAGIIEKMSEREIIDAENLVIDVQFLVQEMLDEQGLTRADLARLTGVSKARLTQLMGSQSNPTLRTLSKIFSALNEKLYLCREGKIGALGSDWTDSEIASKGHMKFVEAPKSVLEQYLLRLKAQYPDPSNENNWAEAQGTVLAA